LDRSLILVAAPAGFGKSTLLSAWLEASEFPNAWLSLDANDNDLGVFLDYFLGAVRAIYPNALTATRDFLSGVDLPPLTVIARSLLNELDDLERDFALVLDDYHIISEPSVHDLLSALLRNPPKRMHLVIATRQDPPLPLSLLRARAQITEVRGQDLRFSAPEIAEFTEQTLGAPLTDEAIAVLAERTEGWAAGLRLATLTLRFSEKIDSQIARLHAENQFVMDYLIGEVQTRVPPAIQSFLLKTAILDQLCGPLCTEVIGPDSADCQPQTYLEWLEHSGMFTTALDTQRQWYRYHPLVRELLRSRLMRQSSADEIAALHLRASAWFARNGYLCAARAAGTGRVDGRAGRLHAPLCRLGASDGGAACPTAAHGHLPEQYGANPASIRRLYIRRPKPERGRCSPGTDGTGRTHDRARAGRSGAPGTAVDQQRDRTGAGHLPSDGQTTHGQYLPEAPGQWPARGGRQRDPARAAEGLTFLSPYTLNTHFWVWRSSRIRCTL
jgi:hypothetical protein